MSPIARAIITLQMGLWLYNRKLQIKFETNRNYKGTVCLWG